MLPYSVSCWLDTGYMYVKGTSDPGLSFGSALQSLSVSVSPEENGKLEWSGR